MKYTMDNVNRQIDDELAKRPFLSWVRDEVDASRLRKRVAILNWLKLQEITEVK